MSRYGMVIDTKKCVGCTDCVIACETENNVPYGFSRSWVNQIAIGKFPDTKVEILSERCNHCSNPPCVHVCPTGASYVNELGIVLVDHDKCIGCKACVEACPYGARYIHPDGYADKCTFCNHRVEKGEDPACVAVCPTHSMYFGDLDDPNSEVSKLLNSREHHTILPEIGTEPKIFYLK
ncbi:4Fe-4S dicluster domain-containing protein [Melioribacteraceae bacterium 4301-Me]|uniref:4Fe-4S dicluster domain-containing protein n=1 Tax=Pyranulibacter aquaticus TaxID=3163344 RepID=UPI0035955446